MAQKIVLYLGKHFSKEWKQNGQRVEGGGGVEKEEGRGKIKGSTSLITRKMQTRTRMPYHLIPVKMFFVRKTRIIK